MRLITADGMVTPRRTCGRSVDSVASGMAKIRCDGYRLPPDIIDQAIWLYLRFTLSLSRTCWWNAEWRCPTRRYGVGSIISDR
jgi:hypothetical protein